MRGCNSRSLRRDLQWHQALLHTFYRRLWPDSDMRRRNGLNRWVEQGFGEIHGLLVYRRWRFGGDEVHGIESCGV